MQNVFPVLMSHINFLIIASQVINNDNTKTANTQTNNPLPKTTKKAKTTKNKTKKEDTSSNYEIKVG